jgi:hypothetical protein
MTDKMTDNIIGVSFLLFVIGIFVSLFYLFGTFDNKIQEPPKATLVLEKDGIKVYKFEDEGHYRYFTNKGETIYDTTYGKGQSYGDGIK